MRRAWIVSIPAGWEQFPHPYLLHLLLEFFLLHGRQDFGNPKIPMATGRKSIPWLSSTLPKVNRSIPLKKSTPTVAKAIPTRIMIMGLKKRSPGQPGQEDQPAYADGEKFRGTEPEATSARNRAATSGL